MLSKFSNILTSSTTYLVNESLSGAIVPQASKQAAACPIFKTGELNVSSNYRSVSLLPSPSKILERVVLCQLQNFISQSDPPILPPEQFAYRHSPSCEDLLSKTINDWHVALDAGKVEGGVMLDMSKVFDCVNHELLLLELQSCGIGGAALVWFSRYLYGRISRVQTSHAPPGEEFEATVASTGLCPRTTPIFIISPNTTLSATQ